MRLSRPPANSLARLQRRGKRPRKLWQSCEGDCSPSMSIGRCSIVPHEGSSCLDVWGS